MKTRRLAAATAAVICAAVSSAGAASADDYTVLVVDPNAAFDTLAYVAGPVTVNPAGQPGAAKTYTHRDGRTITGTIWVLPDPAAATAAVAAAQSAAGITNPKSEPIQVGTGGTFISGTSADGSQALGLVTFTQEGTASAIALVGPANDPPDAILATDLAMAQDTLIKNQAGG